MAANQLATGSSLEAILKNYVRVYEEQLIIDSAAKIYAKVADKGGVRLNDLDGILDAPSQTVAVLFHKHDKDNSGVIDAKELLGIVRQLNFMRGYCGGCYKPVGSNDGTFLCVPCETFALCADCYPDRGQLHPEHSDFKSAIDVEATEASDLPPGVGDLLKAEVDDLFTDVDGNGDGEISTEEFEIYCSTDGWSPEFTKFVLSCDFDGDGRISHREALYLLTGLAMVRACDECNELSFVSDGKLMSCVECTSWYDVCVICWNAGRRSHLHDRFKVVKPFQLRTVGLYYKHSHDDVWAVAVGNANLWEKYKPFVGDKVTKTAKVRGHTCSRLRTGDWL